MLDRLDEGLERERRFVADASHELRTPLALLLTEVELALSGTRSPDELRDALRSAEEEVRRLIALSEDLLALAGADAARLELQTADGRLAALAADVVRRFAATAEAESRSVAVVGDPSAQVVGDRDRLDRVLSNLVDNALRHGAGDVEVRVVGGPQVVVEVSDAGPGLRGGAALRPVRRKPRLGPASDWRSSTRSSVPTEAGSRSPASSERTIVRMTLPARAVG